MRSLRLLTGSSILTAAVAACVHGGTAAAARARASADFGCPEDRTSAVPEGDAGTTTYVASGCGKTARYHCEERGEKAGYGTGEVVYDMVCMAQP
jgi:hypothetical protein